jgi:hypothetical protein
MSLHRRPLPPIPLFFLATTSLLLPACAGIDPSDDDGTAAEETPTSSPTPTPGPTPTPTPSPEPTPTPPPVTLLSAEVKVLSATEVVVAVVVDQAVPVTLKYGVTTPDYARTGAAATHQTFYLYGLEPATDYILQLVARGAQLYNDGFETAPAASGPFVVMFDAGHAETANNADWVIDDNAPTPSPTSPAKESDWKGGYSAWGFALHQTGKYQLVTNTKKFTYGTASGDLASVDALVVPEPNSRITSDESAALAKFVQNGGGLFIIADHDGSDRNGDGLDSIDIWGTVLGAFSPSTGIFIDRADWSEDPADNMFSDSFDPVLEGPYGPVEKMSFNAGTTFHVDLSLNGSLQGLVWTFKTANGSSSGQLALRGYYGSGRIVAIGDSSPADDGTGASGDELYDSWSQSGRNNSSFFLNATAWLVGDSGP